MNRDGHECIIQYKIPESFVNISGHNVSLTCRQRGRVVELLQSRFHFICLSLLNKSLETDELIQDGGGFAPAGYAAQKLFHRPGQETKLVYMQQGWRSTEEARGSLLMSQLCPQCLIHAYNA